jgi:hypothetical protein
VRLFIFSFPRSAVSVYTSFLVFDLLKNVKIVVESKSLDLDRLDGVQIFRFGHGLDGVQIFRFGHGLAGVQIFRFGNAFRV